MSSPAFAKTLSVPVLAVVAMLLAAPGARAAERMIFDIYLLGLKAGELEIASAEGRTRYALAGRLESTGLLDVVRKVRYGAETNGRKRSGNFVPELYTETTVSDERRGSARMEYRRGVPQKKVYTPPRKPDSDDVDPATQGGTIDPLTALYAALRDVPREKACRIDQRLFDGRRSTRLWIEPVPGDPLRCRGLYRRIAGYDADELAERRDFPFEMRLERLNESKVRVAEIRARTLYGRARLVRR